MKEAKDISPLTYFEHLKSQIKTIDNKTLKECFNSIYTLANKYNKAGQVKSLEKLRFLTTVLEKEEQLINLGITKYVYRSVVEDYIDNISKDVVKITEVCNYTREIPDELVEVIEKTKNIFDKFYVVFTDYTGKEERHVEQERKERDPILFGVFTDEKVTADRFYYLGDWEDEYCDLTLDKLVAEYSVKYNTEPTNNIIIPSNNTELLNLLDSYIEVADNKYKHDNKFFIIRETKFKRFIKNIKSIFN